MKNEPQVYPYTVENIQMVFRRISCVNIADSETCFPFSIEIDGVEVVPMTDRVNRFNDFLLYDLSSSEELVFKLHYSASRVGHTYKFLLQGKDQFEVYLKEKNERLKAENKTLRQTVKKQDRSKYYEKVEGIKAIDAGEFVVVFVPKKEMETALGEQLKHARAGVTMLERVERLFHRFVFRPKTK